MQRSNKEVAKFYKSKQWKQTRQAYYIYRNGLCERCGRHGKIKEDGRLSQMVVHHKKYITVDSIKNPDVTLSFDNLELLCQDCHNKEHQIEELACTFDSDGNLVPPQSI